MKTLAIVLFYNNVNTETQAFKADKKIYNFEAKIEKAFGIKSLKDYEIAETPIWGQSFDFEVSDDFDIDKLYNWIYLNTLKKMDFKIFYKKEGDFDCTELNKNKKERKIKMQNEDYSEKRNGLFTGQQVSLKQAILEIIWVSEIILAIVCLFIGLGIFIYSFFNPSLYIIFWGFFIGIFLFYSLMRLSIGYGFPLMFIDFKKEN